MTFYPNPSGTTTTVSLPSNVGVSDLQICNSIGVVVIERKFGDEQTATLDLSGFADGIYFARLAANGQRWEGHIMKTR